MKPKHVQALRSEFGGVLTALCVLFLSCGMVYFSRTRIREAIPNSLSDDARAPLYLPQARYVRLVTLGYDTLASKLIWFNTINYFGKQVAGTQDYRWLGQMCELVTVLDAKAKHTFEFCGTLLSWMAREPELSTKLLTAGIDAHPDYWRFLYLRGFNYWFFQNRADLAKADLLRAAKIPGAPTFLQTIASRFIAKEDGPTLARQFLEEFVANAKDPAAKKALEKKLLLARLSERLSILQSAVDKFKEAKGAFPTDLPTLVTNGYLKALPEEPYGKEFVLENGKVKSTSNKQGLNLNMKTAETSPAFNPPPKRVNE
jgi:hypothetical protein